MQQSRGGGGQDARHAQKNQAQIKAHNEAVVPMDAIHKALTDAPQRHQLEQILGGDGDIGDLPCDGGAGGDGDTGIGLRQGRGVVDAVTDHDDRVSGGTLPADEVCLILRQDLGVELVHPYLLRHTGGGTAVVAGHHDHLADAAVVERTDGVLGLGPKGIVDTDHRR